MYRMVHSLCLIPFLGILVTGCALKFEDRPVDRPDTTTDPDVDTTTDPDAPPDTSVDPDADSTIPDILDPDTEILDTVDEDDPLDAVDAQDTPSEDVAADDVPTDTFVNPYDPVDLITSIDLDTLLTTVVIGEICTGTGDVINPTSTRRNAWIYLLDELLAPTGGTVDWPTVLARSLATNLSVFVLRDPSLGDYVVIVDPDECEGIYVVDLDADEELVVQVPYPVNDTGALELGIHVFQNSGTTGTRALMIAGTDRCYDPDLLPCDGQTTACAGSLENAHYSDTGFNPNTIFHRVHTYFMDWSTDTVMLQIQDQSDASDGHAILSDGTTIKDTSSLSYLLRDAMRVNLGAYSSQILSCNSAGDTGYTSTCGTTNAQGRLVNGSTNQCGEDATASANRFILMELSSLMLGGTLDTQIMNSVQTVLDTL